MLYTLRSMMSASGKKKDAFLTSVCQQNVLLSHFFLGAPLMMPMHTLHDK